MRLMNDVHADMSQCARTVLGVDGRLGTSHGKSIGQRAFSQFDPLHQSAADSHGNSLIG